MKQITKLLIIVSAIVILAACSQGEKTTVKDVNGKSIALSSYKGKWVIVNYWASWCKPCMEEIPELNQFYLDHQDKDAVVIGVSFDDVSDQEIQDFSKQLNIAYPMISAAYNDVFNFGTIPALPATYIIDPTGSLKEGLFGPQTHASLDQALEFAEHQASNTATNVIKGSKKSG